MGLAALAGVFNASTKHARRAHRKRRSLRRLAGQQVRTEAASIDNVAFVFLKPHACSPEALAFLPKFLRTKGISVLRQGAIGGAAIDKGGIIDAHYASIARVGMCQDLSSLSLSANVAVKFQEGYGKGIEEVIHREELYSGATALKPLNLTPSELLSQCLDSGYEKLGPGLYCSQLQGPSGHVYVLNGFYMRMREKFACQGALVNWFVVSFDASTLSWRSFRADVVGATNPSDAAPGSLRAEFRKRWQELGLLEAPNYQDNAVHASASPAEALKERAIWLGEDPLSDTFGAALHAKGVDLARLLENPVIEMNGHSGHAFDLLEDIDAAQAVAALGN